MDCGTTEVGPQGQPATNLQTDVWITFYQRYPPSFPSYRFSPSIPVDPCSGIGVDHLIRIPDPPNANMWDFYQNLNYEARIKIQILSGNYIFISKMMPIRLTKSRVKSNLFASQMLQCVCKLQGYNST